MPIAAFNPVDSPLYLKGVGEGVWLIEVFEDAEDEEDGRELGFDISGEVGEGGDVD